MPTYEYECDNCGHIFEAFQAMSDKPLTRCPRCQKEKLTRLIGGGAGIIFKGSGFYSTDYRKKDNGQQDKGKPPSCPGVKEGCSGCPHNPE